MGNRRFFVTTLFVWVFLMTHLINPGEALNTTTSSEEAHHEDWKILLDLFRVNRLSDDKEHTRLYSRYPTVAELRWNEAVWCAMVAATCVAFILVTFSITMFYIRLRLIRGRIIRDAIAAMEDIVKNATALKIEKVGH